MTLRALILICVLATPIAAQAERNLLSGPETTTGAAAALALQDSTSLRIEPQAEVTHHLIGGFQDLFIMARVRTSNSSLKSTLAQLNTTADSFGPIRPAPSITSAPWWQPDEISDLRGGLIALPGFASAWIGFGPDPQAHGHYLLYLRATQS